MRKFIFLIIVFIFVSCNESQKDNVVGIPVPESIIQFPFYSIESIVLDKRTLVVSLVDSTSFNNPTVMAQALTWYAFQISSTPIEYDTMRLNHVMPVRDSIPSVLTNKVSKERLTKEHQALDNTIFGDFREDLLKLNWETRSRFKSQQTSILDRVNSLFARHIDTSAYKANFPNNNTWFGIDCFPLFQTYFIECIRNEESIGHELIMQIEISSGYFVEEDKKTLLALIEKYRAEFIKE